MICAVAAFTILAAAAVPGVSGEDLFTFALNENGREYTLAACDESVSGCIEIPETHNGLPVTAIGEDAFTPCSAADGVKIPACITEIGAYAAGYTAVDGIYEKTDGFRIFGDTETAAEEYAKANGFDFVTELAAPVLKKVSVIKTGVKIEWAKVKNAGGYIVYKKAPGEGWQRIGKTDRDTLSIIDLGVTSGINYRFTVKAYYNSQTGDYDKTGIAFLFLAPPKPLSVENTETGVKFTWSPVSGAKGYRVYKKTNGSSWQKLADIAASKPACFTDTAAVSGQTLTYTVRAFNGSAASNYYSGLTIKCLSQPFLISAAARSGSVTVKWQKVPGATLYRVYKRTPGNGWQVLAEVGGTKTAFADTSVTNGQNLLYTVKAFNGKYKSDFDKIGVRICYLDTPVLKECTAAADGVIVNWQKNSAASGYNVYRKSNGGSWQKIAVLNGSQNTAYKDKLAVSGKIYYYTVIAFKADSQSHYNTDGVKGGYVAAPHLTEIKNINGKIKLSWTSSGTVTGHFLYRKAVGGKYARIATLGPTQKTYTDTSAAAGKQYIYTLKVYTKGVGASEKSNELKIRILDPNKPMVALTYDDGPYSPVTNRILDVLEDYGGKATFFVVGNRVNEYASSVRRAAAMGCEIGNHTYNHTILTSAGASTIRSELSRTSDVVERLTGERPVIMRPPGGGFNSTVKANCDYPMIIWSVDTLDWKTRDSYSTVSSVKRNVKDGSIILMHDLYGATASATESFVPWLVSQGYQLVTVSELMEAKGIDMKDGTAYYSAS